MIFLAMMRLLATLTLAVVACTSTPSTEAIRDREWKLSWIDGVSSVPADGTPTLRLAADGRVSAQTGCNSAGGSYTAEGDRLSIAKVFSTKRACTEAARNELESAYLRTLERTRSFRVAEGQLELLDDSGAVIARFN